MSPPLKKSEIEARERIDGNWPTFSNCNADNFKSENRVIMKVTQVQQARGGRKEGMATGIGTGMTGGRRREKISSLEEEM